MNIILKQNKWKIKFNVIIELFEILHCVYLLVFILNYSTKYKGSFF